MSNSLFPHLVKTFDGDHDVDQLQNGRFRAHRYLASDLRPLRAAVTLKLLGNEIQCELNDLSGRGIAVRWNGTPPASDTVVEDLQVSFDGYVLFKGDARVVSAGDRHGTPSLALDFAGGILNVHELLDLRAVKQWQRASSAAGKDHARRIPGYEHFKAQIAELSLLLRETQRDLEKLESTPPWSAFGAEQQSIAWQAFVDCLRATFVQSAIEIMEKVDLPLDGTAAPVISVLRSFSRRLIQPFLIWSPAMRRAVEKPLGYPGDYHLMSALQEQRVDGASLFAKAMSLLFNELPFASAVRARSRFIQRSLVQVIAARLPSGKPLRLFAIAPGSADELLALVSSLDGSLHVDVVVVDHDGGSLTHIHDQVQRLKKSNVTFTLRHEGVKRLLREPAALEAFGEFDFIYSATLFDYLRPQPFAALTRLLTSRLAKNGTLLVSGFPPALWDRWFMELHLDWHLFYRTQDELLSLVKKAAPNLICQPLQGDESNVFVKVSAPSM